MQVNSACCVCVARVREIEWISGQAQRLYQLRTPNMKFVALISGGKDSFYNIMECMNNGHTLHALANLHPIDPSVHELDSFMFQTVGHDIIEYYKQCVGDHIPLYRRAIKGSSSNVSLEYEVTKEDETEDLYELLLDVKKLHPDIEGVSCGAILSHYQRTRVENVCSRLNLTCLAYLWQRDQTQLMLEMCQLGLDAILIKVAAIGLTKHHLGKLLVEMFPVLTELNSIYDVHVCGEGGEFESLVLDTPFFVKRLLVKKLEIVLHSLDAFFLSLEVEVEDKTRNNLAIHFPHPSLLLEDFESIKQAICENSNHLKAQNICSRILFAPQPFIFRSGHTFHFGNLVSNLLTVEEQTLDILSTIRKQLESEACQLSQIQHMTVLVSKMSDFSKINGVYESFFEGVSLPPSRVCVETTLPMPYKLQMSYKLLSSRSVKSGIHIRSRSYWAPQNIGPYSQAIVEIRDSLKVATLSGQIPLIPRSMTIDHSMTPPMLSALSLQHLHRVKSLIKVNQIAQVICYITGAICPNSIAKVWQRYVCEVENNPKIANNLLILQVTALPREATVEWAGLTYETMFDMYADDSEEEESMVPRARESVAKRFRIVTETIGNDIFTQFTGDNLEDLESFLRDPLVKNTYVNVISDIGTIHKLSNLGINAEWTPVVSVSDSKGINHRFGVIWVS